MQGRRRWCSREELGKIAEGPVRRLHRSPTKLRHSHRLSEALLGLYGDQPDRVLQERLQPFIERNWERLEAIYRDHETLPTARCLNDYEGLMVLEWLWTDPDRLRDQWPLDPEEFQAVATVGGVRVAAF